MTGDGFPNRRANLGLFVFDTIPVHFWLVINADGYGLCLFNVPTYTSVMLSFSLIPPCCLPQTHPHLHIHHNQMPTHTK
jgi:hypothetical protein